MYRNQLNPNRVYFMEKLISALSYLTMGFVGFIYIIITVFTKTSLKPFLKYHIFQSIFLSIGYFLLCTFIGLVCNILLVIPLINRLTTFILFYLNTPFIFGLSFVNMFCYTVLFYLIVTSFQGKYSYLPYISNIIKANVR